MSTLGTRTRIISALFAGCILLGASPAAAGDGDPAGGGFGLTLGGFVGLAPKYDGSRDYRVIGFPIVFPTLEGGGWLSGRVDVKGADDVRLRVFEAGGFEAGPLLGWRFGREEDDGARLRGLGDVDGGLVGGGYVAYRLGALRPFISYHHQLTGDDTGGVLRFGTEARAELIHGIALTGTVGATYASSDYMDAFFSVSSAQAATPAAGLNAFDAEAGIKDVYVGLSASIPLADSWKLRLAGRYSHLVGDAADSPVVETESQWSGGIGLTWSLPVR